MNLPISKVECFRYGTAMARSPRATVGPCTIQRFTLPPEIGLVPAILPSGDRFPTSRHLPPRFNGEQVSIVLNWTDELKAKVPTGSR